MENNLSVIQMFKEKLHHQKPLEEVVLLVNNSLLEDCMNSTNSEIIYGLPQTLIWTYADTWELK